MCYNTIIIKKDIYNPYIHIICGGMVMLGIIKTFFGKDGNVVSGRMKYLLLTAELENELTSHNQMNHSCMNVVNIAKTLREMIKKEEIELTKTEKIKLVKMFNQAKVNAVKTGTDDSFRIFNSLDSISSDVVTLL